MPKTTISPDYQSGTVIDVANRLMKYMYNDIAHLPTDYMTCTEYPDGHCKYDSLFHKDVQYIEQYIKTNFPTLSKRYTEDWGNSTRFILSVEYLASAQEYSETKISIMIEEG